MIKKNNKVILVDRQDNVIMLQRKDYTHIKGLLHRAISVFIFNNENDLLIQQRSSYKYHSSLLWSNTCCGHPYYGEIILQAAHRCLNKEMGFDCFLENRFHFIYKSKLDNGLIEHELDYVFLGRYDGSPKINHKEVAHWKWISIGNLLKEININKYKYSIWFRIIINNYLEKLKL